MPKAAAARRIPLSVLNEHDGSGPYKDDEMLLASSIGYQMRKTHRMLEACMQAKLAAHDIQIGMWYFLRILWIEDGLTQRELSRRVGATEPTTLEQLRNMAQRGLIERRRSDQDRRKLVVLLTNEGRRLKRELLRYVGQINATALRGFGEAEVETLRALLHRIRENIRPAGSS